MRSTSSPRGSRHCSGNSLRKTSAKREEVGELDFLELLTFSTEAESRVGLTVGVELDPVCGPSFDRVGHAAADHQVGTEACDLLIKYIRGCLENLELGA